MYLFNKNLLNNIRRNKIQNIFLRSFAAKTADFSKENNTINVTSMDELKTILDKSEVPVLLDFYADWCPHCKQLSPILEEQLMKHQNFKLVKINIDQHKQIAEKYEVSGIPHIFLFKDGKKVDDFIGVKESNLTNMLNNL